VHRRTVSAALCAAGRDRTADFARYDRGLNRAHWSARAEAGILLGRLVAAFAPDGTVVIGVDDTLERRWGKRIAARGQGSHRARVMGTLAAMRCGPATAHRSPI
jgi:hypothetical protein